ncbi:MAG: peptide deformylase [Collinsella phocaeensis]
MIRELIHDDAVLSQPCAAATAEDAAIAQDLVDTLAAAEDAACLAANQIGETKAITAFVDDEERVHVIYNPKMLLGLGAYMAEERCLSHEEIVSVKRFAKVKVSFEELVDGKLVARRRDYTGFVAQMVQHMIDHCNGKLV